MVLPVIRDLKQVGSHAAQTPLRIGICRSFLSLFGVSEGRGGDSFLFYEWVRWRLLVLRFVAVFWRELRDYVESHDTLWLGFWVDIFLARLYSVWWFYFQYASNYGFSAISMQDLLLPPTWNMNDAKPRPINFFFLSLSETRNIIHKTINTIKEDIYLYQIIYIVQTQTKNIFRAYLQNTEDYAETHFQWFLPIPRFLCVTPSEQWGACLRSHLTPYATRGLFGLHSPNQPLYNIQT